MELFKFLMLPVDIMTNSDFKPNREIRDIQCICEEMIDGSIYFQVRFRNPSSETNRNPGSITYLILKDRNQFFKDIVESLQDHCITNLSKSYDNLDDYYVYNDLSAFMMYYMTRPEERGASNFRSNNIRPFQQKMDTVLFTKIMNIYVYSKVTSPITKSYSIELSDICFRINDINWKIKPQVTRSIVTSLNCAFSNFPTQEFDQREFLLRMTALHRTLKKNSFPKVIIFSVKCLNIFTKLITDILCQDKFNLRDMLLDHVYWTEIPILMGFQLEDSNSEFINITVKTYIYNVQGLLMLTNLSQPPNYRVLNQMKSISEICLTSLAQHITNDKFDHLFMPHYWLFDSVQVDSLEIYFKNAFQIKPILPLNKSNRCQFIIRHLSNFIPLRLLLLKFLNSEKFIKYYKTNFGSKIEEIFDSNIIQIVSRVKSLNCLTSTDIVSVINYITDRQDDTDFDEKESLQTIGLLQLLASFIVNDKFYWIEIDSIRKYLWRYDIENFSYMHVELVIDTLIYQYNFIKDRLPKIKPYKNRLRRYVFGNIVRLYFYDPSKTRLLNINFKHSIQETTQYSGYFLAYMNFRLHADSENYTPDISEFDLSVFLTDNLIADFQNCLNGSLALKLSIRLFVDCLKGGNRIRHLLGQIIYEFPYQTVSIMITLTLLLNDQFLIDAKIQNTLIFWIIKLLNAETLQKLFKVSLMISTTELYKQLLIKCLEQFDMCQLSTNNAKSFVDRQRLRTFILRTFDYTMHFQNASQCLKVLRGFRF